MRKSRILQLLCLSILVAGCVQQDVYIVLHKDSSGEYSIKRVLGEMESGMIAALPSGEREKFLKDSYNINDLHHIKQLSYNLEKDSKDPTRFIETSRYSFSNLGLALPSLEEVVAMNPRYSYRNGRFVVFRNREKEEWDGWSSKEMDDAYLNLIIEFPVKPESSNGTVKGNTVFWHFDAEAIQKLIKTDLGTNFIKASIPASAIQVDLKPRLVKHVEKKEKKPKVLDSFNAEFPILGKESRKEMAKLQVFFPLGDISIPFSYQKLQVKSLVIGNKNIESVLKTKNAGVFSGKDRWGQPVSGFPLSLEFPISDPWMSSIDRLEIAMEVNIAKKKKEHAITIDKIDKREFPKVVLESSNPKLKKVVITEVDPEATYYGPWIVLLAKAQPNSILTAYLDTDYGLRYEAKDIDWDKETLEGLDQDLRTSLQGVFTEKEEIYKCTMDFEKMPSSSFSLVFVTVEKQVAMPKTFRLEDIDVAY